jgi:NitT/TauT family transport system permease protein
MTDATIQASTVPAPSSPKPGRRRLVSRLIPIVTILACLLVWEAAVRLLKIPVFMLPPPSAVLHEVVAQHAYFLKHAIATTWAIVLGFVLAVLVGVPMATLMVYSKTFSEAIHPVLITAQVLPKVALAPLFIVWFGFGLLPKVIMTFLIAFFPIVIDTLTGLMAVRPESLMLIRSMGGNRWQSFWKIRMPTALPSMFAGFKVGMTFAVVGAIVAEFVASDSGLGYVLVEARANLAMVTVFAAITWLIVMGFVFYYAVEFAERLLLKGRSRKHGHELGAGL